jgi:hypothetical protein
MRWARGRAWRPLALGLSSQLLETAEVSYLFCAFYFIYGTDFALW